MAKISKKSQNFTWHPRPRLFCFGVSRFYWSPLWGGAGQSNRRNRPAWASFSQETSRRVRAGDLLKAQLKWLIHRSVTRFLYKKRHKPHFNLAFSKSFWRFYIKQQPSNYVDHSWAADNGGNASRQQTKPRRQWMRKKSLKLVIFATTKQTLHPLECFLKTSISPFFGWKL